MTPAPNPSPESAPPEPPRHRHVVHPPASVRLPVDDVIAAMPPGAWIGSEAEKQREVALPAAEIFEGNFPRIRLRRLAELLPGCVRPPAGAPEWVALPTDRVVLAYRPESRREELPVGDAAPSAATETSASAPDTAVSLPAWKRILKPVLAPPPGGAATDPQPPADAVAESATVSAPPPAPLGDRRLAPEAEDRLHRVFMTEEPLTVVRALELAVALPGIKGALLARGAETVRAGAPAPGLDAARIDEVTAAFLGRLRDATGLPLLPAITVYGESGPVSFLRRGPATLVVLHAERGFLPGVRETFDTLLDLLPA